MKRLLIACALMILSAAVAHAGTSYDLHPAACGFNTYGTCEVANDGAQALLIGWNANGTVTLSKWAIAADKSRTLSDQFTANIGANPLNGVSNAVLTDAAGNAAQVSGTFATRRTCVGSGRGQHCTVYVTFLGGTAQLP